MNRFEEVKDIFYTTIEEKSTGIYKKEAYFHSLQVCGLCKQEALHRNLDSELAGIIGLLHDYSTYLYQNSFEHAKRSSQLAQDILEKTNLFSVEEITIVVNAIFNHSDKHKIHDKYSELIKDVDIFVQNIDNLENIPDQYQERIKKITH